MKISRMIEFSYISLIIKAKIFKFEKTIKQILCTTWVPKDGGENGFLTNRYSCRALISEANKSLSLPQSSTKNTIYMSLTI